MVVKNNIKNFILILTLISIAAVGQGQTHFDKKIAKARSQKTITQQIDQLKQVKEEVLGYEFYDTLALIDYALAFRYEDFFPKFREQLRHHSKSIIAHCEKADFDYYGKQKAYFYLGKYYSFEGKKDSALYFLDLCMKNVNFNEPRTFQSAKAAYIRGAQLFFKEKKYQECVNYFTPIFLEPWFEKLEDKDKGAVYMFYGKYISHLPKTDIEREAIANYNIANKYFKKGINRNDYNKKRIEQCTDLSSAYYYRNHWVKMEEYTKKGIEIYNNSSLNNPGLLFDLYTNLSIPLEFLHKPKEALIYIQKADSIRLQEFPDSDYEKRTTLDNWAMTLLANQDYDAAIEKIDEAIGIYFDPKQSIETVFDHGQKAGIINLLDDKGMILFEYYKKTNDELHLDECLYTISQMDTLLNIYLQELSFEEGIYDWKDQSFDNYQLGIDAAFAKGDHHLLWNYFEKNKGAHLLQGLKFDENTRNEIQQWKYDIQSMEIKKDYKNLDSLTLLSVNDSIANLKKKIVQVFASEIKDLQLKDPLMKLDSIQHLLNRNQTMVSYAKGQENYYAIVVTNNSFDAYSIAKIEDLQDEVTRFRSLCETPSDEKTLKEQAACLYDILLDKKLPKSTKKLIIIPDHLLSFISFDVLVNNNRYIIHDHIISYHISGSLYHHTFESQIDQPMAHIIAPDYQAIDTGIAENQEIKRNIQLSALPFAQKEATRVAEILNCEVKSSLNSNQFRNIFQSHHIVHFAGHAVLNRQNESLSYLALSDSISGERISAAEINQLKSNCQLVSLSACNTLPGTIRQGEGIFGINRSFFKAGTKSVVSTLWEVDDQSTSNIITNFYSNLMEESMAKDESLHQAKINYLQNAPDYVKHPNYWAGIILNGNTAPLQVQQGSLRYLWYILMVSGALGLILLYVKRSKNKSITES